MNKSLKFKYSILILLISNLLLICSYSKAEEIKKIIINGNDRVSDETVIMFSKLKIGDQANDKILNIALKNLYETNYFEQINIKFNDGLFVINVTENPIIQEIKVIGIDNKKISEGISKITKKLEKYPFIKDKVNDQTKLLKNMLKSYGYYFVKLNTEYIENDNNSINLIYNFDLGEIAKIKKITFIGNKIFKDSTLRNIIISEETKFWKFLTRNKFLDTERINLDKNRLLNYYQNNGYYNVQIKSSSGILVDNNQFELIFNINAGEKYKFGNIKINSIDNIPDETFNDIKKKLNKLEGKTYSQKISDKLLSDINEKTLLNEFVFLNAKYKSIIRDTVIDLIVEFDELDKIFVDRINVYGNYITDEKVVRNTLIVDEGDAYNEILFDKSIQNLKKRNIFKEVKYTKTSNDDNKQVIDITVEEKPTGEIFAGAGTGTSGTNLSAGIKENNYLGLGIKLDTDVTITEDSLKGKFTVINPNINNSDKSLKTAFENSTTDNLSTSGYKTSRTGISVGTEFEQYKDLYVNLEQSNFYENLETSDAANSIVKKQEGDYFENLLSYNISFNKLNNNFKPTDGFITNFSQTLPIYSEDWSFENSFSTSKYMTLNDNLTLSARFLLKTINSLDDDVRVSKRINIPGRYLRGFESGKIGPKDGTQFIGGNYASSLNLNSTLPNVFFENENIDLNFFIDLANVWEVDYDSSLDSNKIRSATGIALNWFSTIGPLSFSYAIPLSEANTDVTEKFRFQIGTSF